MNNLANALINASAGRAQNLARIELQRNGTPSEVAAASGFLNELPPHAAEWVRRLSDYCFWEKSEPEQFRRETTEATWSYFTGTGPIASRELIVGFAGGSANVYQPSPVILQRLDAGRHDLLIVRDLERSGYADVSAGSALLNDLAQRIAFVAEPYGSLVTLGASMGGWAALAVGQTLGARRAISVGGSARGRTRTLSFSESVPRRAVEAWSIFGEKSLRDREGALSLARQCAPVRLIAIAGVADHNVPHAAFRSGALSSFFELLLADESLPLPLDANQRSEHIVTVRLQSRCAAPPWAVGPDAPRSWNANAVPRPTWARQIFQHVRLPRFLASAIERAALHFLGVVIKPGRIGERR